MNLQNTAVILDACVLLAPRLADVIMDMRKENMMAVHWSTEIDKEFLRNAVKVFELTAEGAARRLKAMKGCCPEWEAFITKDDLGKVPENVDLKDHHVAAAALAMRRVADKTQAGSEESEEDVPFDVILVSANVKHLARNAMAALNVRVLKPGEFLNEAYLADPAAMERAIDKAVNDLHKPPYSLAELLFALAQHGAKAMTAAIAAKRNVSPVPKPRPPGLKKAGKQKAASRHLSERP